MKPQTGFTLIELMFSFSILVVCALALGATFLSVADQSSLTEEEILATNAIRAKMAEIRANVGVAYVDDKGDEYQNINGIVARYQQSSFSEFNIDGLVAPEGASCVGTVVLHLDETDVPVELGGSNLDLDGDDVTDKTSFQASDSIDLLPVEVKVTWQSQTGTVTMQRFMMLARTD